MGEIKNLFSDKKNAELQSVEYRPLGMCSGKFKVSCVDTISVLDSDTKKLRVLVKRSVSLDPPCLFSIEASCYIDHFLKKTNIAKVNWADYNLSDEINSNPEFYAVGVTERLSLLISEMTAAFGESPLITPPIFTPARKESTD